jgi:uncharacterized protein
MHLRFLAVAGLLLAQPAHAQAFNCRNAGTADEAAICADARLGRLDESLNRRFYRLRARLPGPDRARLDRDEAAWLRARGRCGSSRACIAGAYQARLAELSGGSAEPQVVRRTCITDARGNQTCAETGR